MWIHSSKERQTLSDRRRFRAKYLGFENGAPRVDHAEGDNELYSKGHDNGAHELHRSEGALFSAWRDGDDLKLGELIRTKERALSNPTPPYGPRKAVSPDSFLFPPESPPLSGLREAAFKTTKTRRPSSGPRKTHDQSKFAAGVVLSTRC